MFAKRGFKPSVPPRDAECSGNNLTRTARAAIVTAWETVNPVDTKTGSHDTVG